VTAARVDLVDTHAHLDDDQFAVDLDAVLARSEAAGIRRILNIGYRPERWRTTRELAGRYPVVAYTLGLHPHHADEWSPATEAQLIALLKEGEALALGEIGVDSVRGTTSLVAQQRVFARQLEIAAELRLPVVVHHREAEAQLTEVLSQADSSLVCILHSFDGSDQLAAFALSRDCYFGVGGLMTRSAGLQRIIRDLPIERILLETDAPYLLPKGMPGRRNEPAFVRSSAQFLADLRGQAVEVIAALTVANAARVLGSRFIAAEASALVQRQ
jgi:TatD DNase family protein